MSFFSALTLFYPGKPPQITFGEFYKFCANIRSDFTLKNDQLAAKIEYWKEWSRPIAAWDNMGLVGIKTNQTRFEHTWDYTQKSVSWDQLFSSSLDALQIIRQAHVNLGNMPLFLSEQLTVSDDDSYIAPAFISVSLGPVIPVVLNDSLPSDTCYGGIKISISGMGYFSWQPLPNYWKAVYRSHVMQHALKLCRESFPVPPSLDSNQLRVHLGDLFLNYDEYHSGDWVVSVSESG